MPSLYSVQEKLALAYFTLLRPFYLKKAGDYLVDPLSTYPSVTADATWVCGSGAVTISCARHAVDTAIAGKSGKYILFGGGNDVSRMPFRNHFRAEYASYYQRMARRHVLCAHEAGLALSEAYHEKFGSVDNLKTYNYVLPSDQRAEGKLGMAFFEDYYFMRTGRKPEDDGFVLAYEDQSRNAQQNYKYATNMHTQDGYTVDLEDFDFVRVNTVPFGPRRQIATGLALLADKKLCNKDLVLMPDMAWPIENGVTIDTWKNFYSPLGKGRVPSCVPGVVMHEYLLMKGFLGKGGKYAKFFKDYTPEAEVDRMLAAFAKRPSDQRAPKPKEAIIPNELL